MLVEEFIRVTSSGEQLVLIASVRADPDGKWVAEIDLGDIGTVTNRFTTEDAAKRYAHELAAWLRHR